MSTTYSGRRAAASPGAASTAGGIAASVSGRIATSSVGRIAALVGIMVALLGTTFAAWAQEAPDALVKTVSEEVLQIVRTDPRVQAGDRDRVREVIDAKLAPHFDFERMTALAVGRAWRTATPEQQKQLVDQFRTLLARTYSNAFVQFRDQKIVYKPLKADPAATDATVRTEIVKPGGQPVQIDYSMGKKGNEWKAYDVIVGGVSLVTNYRDEFNQQVQAGGVDGLIKSLAAKNAAPPTPPPAK